HQVGKRRRCHKEEPIGFLSGTGREVEPFQLAQEFLSGGYVALGIDQENQDLGELGVGVEVFEDCLALPQRVEAPGPVGAAAKDLAFKLERLPAPENLGVRQPLKALIGRVERKV